ncbi:hypothetical protein LT493_11695 [Streptomyces tricolor]|nr:hypothetical protein [Streptomyces tricolor]
MWLAELLRDKGVSAAFFITGDKARALVRRQRLDVFEALRSHDIGYHTNHHSTHPTIAEYLEPCGWADGVAEGRAPRTLRSGPDPGPVRQAAVRLRHRRHFLGTAGTRRARRAGHPRPRPFVQQDRWRPQSALVRGGPVFRPLRSDRARGGRPPGPGPLHRPDRPAAADHPARGAVRGPHPAPSISAIPPCS